MARPKQTIKETEISLRFKTKDLFGKAIADDALIESMAYDMIDKIRNRTLSGYGVWEDGRVKKFVKYSPKYEAAKGQTNVDLEFTGDMLSSIELLDYSPQSFSIGIIGPDAPKAHGHMTGQNGVGPLPKRPFLNLTDSDISSIVRKYKDDVDRQSDKTARKSFADNRADTFGFTEADILDAIKLLQSSKGPKIR